MMEAPAEFSPGSLVRARGREWVVLPETQPDLLKLRPLGGAEADATLIYLPLEPEPPVPATFDLPDPSNPGSQEAALLLRDALRLKLRAGAGPFRSFGNINVEPRAYQLVPLLMALKLDTVRLLIADDVGIGKTIEAGLIARELLDRAEVDRMCVICPPHLCEQWQVELADKFGIDAEVVRTGTATRLERGLRPDESVFEAHPFTVVSLDYIKSDRRRDDFLRACPEFVIVDEAHTCVQANTQTRHQRYRLLKGLAESGVSRHMVLLTATPHSGDDTAFHNLLGLLDPRFAQLAEMPDSNARRELRAELSAHLVQRRRGDIAEWREAAVGFPIRESREATYRLSGDWGALFDEVLAYARSMVTRAEGGTALQQRMSWWAALALLRCLSSSPAAASQALRTRLRVAIGDTDRLRVAELDRFAANSVMDTDDDDLLSTDESVPAGTVDSAEDAASLRRLFDRADALRGPDRDPKLETVIREVSHLISAKFRPVVFCRYIATAHYVGQALRAALPAKTTQIEVVTGELTADQREERVDGLGEMANRATPVLVATDCLSEGVNLQRHFNAVVHYDLTWNPTRHEQREGRADRFGQASPVVRALMVYGEDNPVDGAVLRVILRKAERIRAELGVAVPLPADNNKVVEAVMKAVLLRGGDRADTAQMTFDFGDVETQVDEAWKTAQEKASRTVFAQRRLRPEDVMPEWQRSLSVLGSSRDVARFVRVAAQRLGAPLNDVNGWHRLPVAHLPKPLQDRLEAMGVKESANVVFDPPAPIGATFVHRTHALVSALADHVAEQALDTDTSELGARTTAIFTQDVDIRTVMFLLRLRSQILVEHRRDDGRYRVLRSLLAEECLGIVLRGGDMPQPLTESDALSLLEASPGRNMDEAQKTRLIEQALALVPTLQPAFDALAHDRARELLEDHRRVRAASDARGFRYEVVPSLPVDIVGAYVFVPMASF